LRTNSKYRNQFSMDQIKTMSTSELYNHINKYRALIEDLQRRDEDSVQPEREFCYLEQERLKREKSRR